MKINLLGGKMEKKGKKKEKKGEAGIEIRDGVQYSAREALELVLSWNERECRVILLGLIMGFSLPDCVKQIEQLRAMEGIRDEYGQILDGEKGKV